MQTRFTFSQKLAAGFAVVMALAGALAALSIYALRSVAAQKDEVIDVAAQTLVDAERLHGLAALKAADSRGYLVTREDAFLVSLRETRAKLRGILETLRHEVRTEEERRLLQEIEGTEATHEGALQGVLALRSGNASVEAIGARYDRDVRPLRLELDRAIDRFVEREDQLLKEGRHASTEAAARAIRLVVTLLTAGAVAAVALSLLLGRALSRQISSAVGHVESSTAELQSAAGQQATGAKEQATAMTEIATTMNELLATARQIAEGAQSVARIAGDTAAAARAGDQAVQRSQESVGAIRRQVDLVVSHMLELGRKSQEVGNVLDVINELSEQTNILAINASIEAAGAGDAGKRFAVVADEIRKLADRVGGSTKDIRSLIDDVRSAVNTTVMATESGSKSVDAGTRQFSEVAAGFAEIVRLVGSTTDASREIELSTKQQTTAVEQVNVAMSNVAQAAREAEASSGQTLQTAAQLADMSRSLARLVVQRAAA